MKTISALLLFLAIVSFRPKTETTAIPTRQQGLDVYVMSEPTRKYEVIKTGSTDLYLNCKTALNPAINAAAKVEGASGVIIHYPVSWKYSVIKYVD